MLALRQTTGYAILALSMMEGPDGKPLLVRDIAKVTRIPKPYLSKMINRLAACGLIETRRGVNGGVLLARNAGTISLVDVAEAVEGKAWSTPCLIGFQECSDHRGCPIHPYWKKTAEGIRRRLAAISLADAASFECAHARRRHSRRRGVPCLSCANRRKGCGIGGTGMKTETCSPRRGTNRR